VVEDHEMEFERGHEDENRDYDQAEDACPPMSGLFVLNQLMNMMKTGLCKKRTNVSLVSPNFSHRSSIV